MNKQLAGWANQVLTVTGLVLVAAFFVAWIGNGTTGWTIARHAEHWLFLVPVSGAVLALAAGSRSSATRPAAIAAGLLVAGDLMFEMMRGALHGGLELWLMLGGAALVLASLSDKHRALRTLGGLAVLAGFFAPWTHDSMFRGLLHGADFVAALGVNIKILWLIPLAGVAAIASTKQARPGANKLALVAGLAVFGSMLWMIGSVANLVFAWGAWATLGASTTALALGVLAPGAASTTTR